MFGGECVELGVLAGLESLVRLSVPVELAGAQHELPEVVLVRRLNPSKIHRDLIYYQSKYFLHYASGELIFNDKKDRT